MGLPLRSFRNYLYTWKDAGGAAHGRLLFVTTNAVNEDESIICFAAKTVRKRLPDRRLSEGKAH